VGKYIKYEKQFITFQWAKTEFGEWCVVTGGSEKQGVYFETIKIIYTDSISYFGAIAGSHKSDDGAGPYFLGARE